MNWPAATSFCVYLIALNTWAADGPELNLPERPYTYTNVGIPEYIDRRTLLTLDNTSADNPTTDAGATLGRMLFYDRRLSKTKSHSCATCHLQASAFSDPRPVSMGHANQRGERNSMSLVNLRFSRAGFFWDERAATLEEAVLIPVHSVIEMGQDSKTLIPMISSDDRYKPHFVAAFGDAKPTEERVAKSLAQFIRSLVSFDTKYDKGAAATASFKDDFPNFSAAENLGKTLFQKNCMICHHLGENDRVGFFSMFRSLGNGFEADVLAIDGGRGDITLNPTDVGLFKSSDLRNVAVTAPYMHDGRLRTLNDVIEHYSTGVHRHPQTSSNTTRLQLDTSQKAALIAFLETLTDRAFLSDPRFSNPWRESVLQPNATEPPPPPAAIAERPLSVQERLEKGQGISPGETREWVLALDKNGDSRLDKQELKPLLDILEKTGIQRVGAARGPRRGLRPELRGAPAKAEGTSALPLRGDFNRDGSVDDKEKRQIDAFDRIVELGDGGRLDIRLDRFLAQFDFTAEQLVSARRMFHRVKNDRFEREQTLNTETLRSMTEILAQNEWAAYEEAVVNRQFRDDLARAQLNPQDGQLIDQLLAFDEDKDGALDTREATALSVAISALPGGFGQAPPPRIALATTTRRLLALDPANPNGVSRQKLPERMAQMSERADANNDGILSPDELSVYFRKTSFAQLIKEGVYIGGGFGNTLLQSADVLDHLSLSPEKQSRIKALLDAHRTKLKLIVQETLADAYDKFMTIQK